MTDKELVRAEIERLKSATMDENGNFISYGEDCAYSRLCELESFIDSMPEDPVKKALAEEAAIKSLPNSPYSVQVDNLGGYIPAWDQEQMFDMFKNGVKWKEQQMMKDAVDGITKVDNNGNILLEANLNHLAKNCDLSQRVKLIIIKEDKI